MSTRNKLIYAGRVEIRRRESEDDEVTEGVFYLGKNITPPNSFNFWRVGCETYDRALSTPRTWLVSWQATSRGNGEARLSRLLPVNVTRVKGQTRKRKRGDSKSSLLHSNSPISAFLYKNRDYSRLLLST